MVPPRQLVMGVPAYARTYTLRRASNSGTGAPIVGPGVPGDNTRVPGFLAYYEVTISILLYYINKFSLSNLELKLLNVTNARTTYV